MLRYNLYTIEVNALKHYRLSSFDICIPSCKCYHSKNIENVPLVQKCSLGLFAIRLLPPLLYTGNHRYISVPVLVPFPGIHWHEIIQYIAFRVWHLSLAPLRCILAVPCISSSFARDCVVFFCMSIHTLLFFFHLYTSCWIVGLFLGLAIRSTWVEYLRKGPCVSMFSFLLGKIKTPSKHENSHCNKNKKKNVLLEKSEEIATERMKRLSQSGHNTQLWMCLVVKVKCDAKRTILYRNQRYIQRNQLQVQRFKCAVLQAKNGNRGMDLCIYCMEMSKAIASMMENPEAEKEMVHQSMYKNRYWKP